MCSMELDGSFNYLSTDYIRNTRVTKELNIQNLNTKIMKNIKLNTSCGNNGTLLYTIQIMNVYTEQKDTQWMTKTTEV
jgi:hypothetical protein